MKSYDAYYDLLHDSNNTIKIKIDKDRDIEKMRSYKISDYKIINDTVVICTFTDGTTQKAICAPEDEFNLDRAIEICVMKQFCGGSSEYNTLVSKALKDVKNIDKAKADAKKKVEDEKAIKARHLAKKIERQKKRAEKARQARIDEMTEAYVAALKEVNNTAAITVTVDDFCKNLEEVLDK
jgi:hypothetical protein